MKRDYPTNVSTIDHAAGESYIPSSATVLGMLCYDITTTITAIPGRGSQCIDDQ